MAKVISSRLVFLGAGLAIALAAGAQEPTPAPAISPPVSVTPEPAPTAPPAVEPTNAGAPTQASAPAQAAASTPAPEASATPARETASPCVPSPTSVFSRPRIPLPPELLGDVVLVKGGSVRVMNKPPSLKPYAIKELKADSPAVKTAVPLNLAAFNLAFGFQRLMVTQRFSFQLAKEDEPGFRPVTARCIWGLASSTTGVAARSFGIEMRVPQGNSVLCEISEAPDAEPWRLFLWVGPLSNLVPAEFPSGGGLVRGEVRYEAVSTNATKPSVLGLKPTTITGTFFKKEGRTVAAVERHPPGRILMACPIPASEQSLFVAVGAALIMRDWEAHGFED